MTNTINTTPDSAIHTRAVLVWLQIGTWTARKYDKAATREITAHYNASIDSARVNKSLLPADAASYIALTQLATSIRAEHYKRALAWTDEGWRLLPTANYMDYTAWYRDVSRQFEAAKATFGADYPALRAAAPSRLNGMWRAEDYPATQDVLARFRLGVEFAPVPAVGDIRVDLGSDQIALIESSVTARVQSATSAAMHDAWTRLYTVVAHISERLNAPTSTNTKRPVNTFRDTLIGNAREVCDALKRLNVTNDPALETLRARVESELSTVDPEILRDDLSVRADTARKADSIMAAMAGFYTVQS